MKFYKIITLVFSLALLGTNFNLSSMESEEESRRAALIARLKSDPIYTLHYKFGEDPPSIEVSHIPSHTGFDGSHGLPKPKSPIEKDPRFRNIEPQNKLILERFSREQIESYLRSQWEQIQFSERYSGQPIPLKGHNKAYGSFEEFALDNFNLYQYENFSEYFKTLPGYEHAAAKLNEMRNTNSKSLGSTVKSATRKVASWLQPGIDFLRRKKNIPTNSVVEDVVGSGDGNDFGILPYDIGNSRFVPEREIVVPGHIDTPTIPKFPFFPATGKEIDGYVNKFMTQLPGRGLPGFSPEDDLEILKGYSSLPGTSSTLPADVVSSIPIVGPSGNIDSGFSAFPSLPAQEGEIDGYVNKFMAQLPGHGIPGFIPGNDLGILKGFGSLPGTTSTVHTDTGDSGSVDGGSIDPSLRPTKRPRLEDENPQTTLPTIPVTVPTIPGSDEKKPSVFKEVGVAALKEVPGILNSLLKLYTGPQQPVQYHQFLPSPYQQVRPMHAGLMLPSAEFTPPFAQFQQTKQNYSRPQLPENQHLFLRQQEPIFMDEDLPGPPVVTGGPIPTTDVAEQQNHDSETLIYDPIAEAEKIAYEDVGMEKAQYTTLDPRITASEISTVNDQILDFQQQYQNTPMAEEATNFCNSAQGFNQIAMVFHQNGNMQEADTFVSLSSRIIDLGNITLQSGAKGVWGSAKYIAKRALEAPGKVWNDPWGVLTKKSKDLGLAVAGGLAIAILPTPIGGGIVAASFGYEIFQNFANKSYEEAVESTAQLLTTDFIVNVASKKGLHHLIPQLLNCGKKVYHGIKNNKILKKAVYDGGKIASNLVNKFGPKVTQKTLNALKNNPSLLEKEKDVLTAANKVAGEISSKVKKFELGNKTGYKFKDSFDIDLRGTKKTYKDALKMAFDKTGAPKSDFEVTKWARDLNGKSHPVEWRSRGGAEVNIDTGHITKGPDLPHVGYQTPGKRGFGGAIRGHIIVDSVPIHR